MGLSYLEVIFICGFLLSFFILIKQRRQIQKLDIKLKKEKVENAQETKKRCVSEASHDDSEEVILPKPQTGILEIKKYYQDDARFKELAKVTPRSEKEITKEVELTELIERFEGFQTQFTVSNQRLVDAESQIKKLTRKLANVENQCTDANKKLAEVERINHSMEKRVVAVEEDHRELKCNLRQAEQNTREALVAIRSISSPGK